MASGRVCEPLAVSTEELQDTGEMGETTQDGTAIGVARAHCLELCGGEEESRCAHGREMARAFS
jgi:hypothetical protein